ncbi:hypothetical protein [Variovorax gossypii]
MFFIAWGLALLHASTWRVRRAWVEQFAAAAVLLATLPLTGALVGDRNLIAGLRTGDGVFVWFELALLVLAVVFAAVAVKLAHGR